MEENKVIKAFKGFDCNLKCRGFQYEVGKTYEIENDESIGLCKKGFHACENPFEVFDYYFMDDKLNMARFCEVELYGEIDRSKDGSSKIASSKIKIKEEIKLADLIKFGVEWFKEKASINKSDNNDSNVDCSQIVSSGNWAQIGSGRDCSQIGSSGNYAQIGSSGNWAQIGSNGDYVKIGSSGDCSHIGSSGIYAHIGSSGDSAKIGSSGDNAKIGSSGNWAHIGSSMDCAQIGSSGDYAQIGSSGIHAQIGSSGDSAQIGSSGDNAKIGSSGIYAQIGSSGGSAKIGSSGNYAHIGSNGNCAQIGSSGDNAKINSTGMDAIIVCAGNDSVVRAKQGSWITLSEWTYSTEKGRFIPKCVKTEYVDGQRIKADTYYKLVNGKFKEIKE